MISSTDRIIFDVSSIASWSGAPVGITRAQNALASYALTERPDIVLSVFDQATASLRALNPSWAAQLIGWDSTLEIRHFEYRQNAWRFRNWLPSRYPILMALERMRLTSDSALTRSAAGAAQRLVLLKRQMPPPFADRDGRRLSVIPASLALGEPLSLGPRDIVVTTGFDWYHVNITAISEMKKRLGFRYVVMCYDIIPLLFPEFYENDDVARYRRHWEAAIRIADRILVNSRCVEADIRAFCTDKIGVVPETAVVPLGYEPRGGMANSMLPAGLSPGRFALFVSTIDPRKGHRLLVDVWSRLVAAGVPQRHQFKLVFVGRRGVKVDTLLRRIDAASGFDGTLVHLTDVSDVQLDPLYREAAFCVYPSRYEGFGLPIIEAYSYGKAVIASTGGALPETVEGLSPCLDPEDEEAWFTALKSWIEDPGARASCEAKIRRSFSHPNWNQAAAQFFAAVPMDRVSTACGISGA